MTPLQTNKPTFFDGSEPLNGFIYVGQPGTDPRTSPKTVTFQDSGGVQFTAPAKLSVINGKVTYNGKPIVALVDGEYSALLFDENMKQVDYIRAFNPSGGGSGGGVDFSEATRVGLTLDDIKAFDAAVGDVIENVGKITAEDGKGERWLVKSATGVPGDDSTLIDLDNALQASRISNWLPRVVWTGSATSVNLTAMDERGGGRYIVELDSGESTEITLYDENVFARALINLDIDTNFYTVSAVRFSGASKNFTAIANSINDITTSPVTAQVDLTITKIYKV